MWIFCPTLAGKMMGKAQQTTFHSNNRSVPLSLFIKTCEYVSTFVCNVSVMCQTNVTCQSPNSDGEDDDVNSDDDTNDGFGSDGGVNGNKGADVLDFHCTTQYLCCVECFQQQPQSPEEELQIALHSGELNMATSARQADQCFTQALHLLHAQLHQVQKDVATQVPLQN